MTEITPFKNFYVAEDYHKNCYEEHRDAAYCNLVIVVARLTDDWRHS
ncbi:MAG TPA: hypothetical protein VE971_02525 [Candidatus Eisenbacteria bacterium]|nr:hypothetical protein [Candidatus Eisenbacteria bacterium]